MVNAGPCKTVNPTASLIQDLQGNGSQITVTIYVVQGEAPPMQNQFRGYCSLIIYFIPDTADFFVLCAFIVNFSFIGKKGTVGILTGIVELFSRWSAQEYSLLCPVSHGKLCAGVTAACQRLVRVNSFYLVCSLPVSEFTGRDLVWELQFWENCISYYKTAEVFWAPLEAETAAAHVQGRSTIKVKHLDIKLNWYSSSFVMTFC